MTRYKSNIRNCLPSQKGPGLLILLLAYSLNTFAQNYVFSGGEVANFGTISLTTSTASPYWGTDRSASPGYWAAVGTGSYTGATDANLNVNGYVKWYASATAQSFTAPVGDQTQLRNLTISGTTASGDIFATAWWNASASSIADPTAPNAGTHLVTSVGAGINSVSTVGFWDWQDFNSTGNGKTITVDIPDLTGFSTAANLRLVGWDGTQWVNLSGSSGASGNTDHSTLAGTMVNGITALAIGSTASVSSDLTPTVDIDDLSFATIQGRDFVVNIFEIIGAQTTGAVSFRVSRISGWDITVPGITLTASDQSGIAGSSDVVGGTTHENDRWLFKQNTGFITMTLKTGLSVAGSGQAILGFKATRKAGTVAGTVQNISATVITGSGGDTNATNNQVITSITAN
jgi:hypothetical protein